MADCLKSLDHDVKAVARDYEPSRPDPDVLAIAIQEQRILFANDRDFGELGFRHNFPNPGVIHLRLGTYALVATTERLSIALTHHADRLAEFIVVGPRRIRVRRGGRQR